MSDISDIKKVIANMPKAEREKCSQFANRILDEISVVGVQCGIVAVALVHAQLTTVVDLARSMRSTPECGE